MLPLQLSQERDEAIFHLTEGRIPVFAHDLVPDYLRTKPEPTAEQRMLAHEQKVSWFLTVSVLTSKISKIVQQS